MFPNSTHYKVLSSLLHGPKSSLAPAREGWHSKEWIAAVEENVLGSAAMDWS
jgi:hypothetical protein